MEPELLKWRQLLGLHVFLQRRVDLLPQLGECPLRLGIDEERSSIRSKSDEEDSDVCLQEMADESFICHIHQYSTT